MFDINNIVIKEKLANMLSFLTEYNIHFAEVMKMTHDGNDILKWIVAGLVLVLFFKNSNERVKYFKPKIIYSIYTAILLVSALLFLHRKSEFLYFNF